MRIMLAGREISSIPNEGGQTDKDRERASVGWKPIGKCIKMTLLGTPSAGFCHFLGVRNAGRRGGPSRHKGQRHVVRMGYRKQPRGGQSSVLYSSSWWRLPSNSKAEDPTTCYVMVGGQELRYLLQKFVMVPCFRPG